MKMYYLIGRVGKKSGMILSSPQKPFLEGFAEVLKERHKDLKTEIVPGISYEGLIKK